MSRQVTDPGARSPVLTAAPRLEERRVAEQRRRRRRTARLAVRLSLAALAVGAPLLALGWLLLASPWLAVGQVVVSGAGRISMEEVRAVAAVPMGEPLARIDTARIAARVAALPAVHAVEVDRRWPATVRIQVRERPAVAGVLTGRDVVLVSAEGIPVGRIPALPAAVPRLDVSQPGPDDPATRAALAVLGELPGPLRSQVAVVRAAAPQRVLLQLRGGRSVVWGAPGGAATKAAAATALLRLPGSQVDVSTPGVAVRRP